MAQEAFAAESVDDVLVTVAVEEEDEDMEAADKEEAEQHAWMNATAADTDAIEEAKQEYPPADDPVAGGFRGTSRVRKSSQNLRKIVAGFSANGERS